MSDSDILNIKLKYANGAYIKVVCDVTLIIPNGVTKIAGRYNATTRFIWCSNLISVTIPKSVESLRDIFYYNPIQFGIIYRNKSLIRAVIFLDGVERVKSGVLDRNSIRTVFILKSVKDIKRGFDPGGVRVFIKVK